MREDIIPAATHGARTELGNAARFPLDDPATTAAQEDSAGCTVGRGWRMEEELTSLCAAGVAEPGGAETRTRGSVDAAPPELLGAASMAGDFREGEGGELDAAADAIVFAACVG